MPTYREICFSTWGRQCAACGISIGVEAHHIDGDRSNNDPQNLIPLCGTCHNLVTSGLVHIDPLNRSITPNFIGLYELGPLVETPPHSVQIQLHMFKTDISNIWEVDQGHPFTLLQDGVSQAYYSEIHMPAGILKNLFDFDALLNPIDPEDPDGDDYKLNRDILEMHSVFRKMEEDAERGRPFSDIVIEFNKDYRIEQPLKILAGQHRAKAICDAVESGRESDRLHGIRVYFALQKEQRAEISLISNTNIAIAKPLIDRFGEQHIGPQSREWSQSVGLLQRGQDFADRVTGTDRFTVQLIRALVVNYYRGINFNGDIDESLHTEVYIPKTGTLAPDSEYLGTLNMHADVWTTPAFREIGRQLAELAALQSETCGTAPEANKELRKIAYRYKVFTPTIVAAWAYVAGLLQRDQNRLDRHYALPRRYDTTKSVDPLNAKQMSISKHQNFDEATYRGLGTRQSPKDAQRLVELFVIQSTDRYAGTITPDLLKLAIQKHVEKVQRRERELLEERAQEVSRQLRGSTSDD